MSPREPALRLDDGFTHLVSMGGAVLLVGDDAGLLLESPLVGDVVRLVDGRRTAVDIAQALGEAHRPEFVHLVLLKMEREGLLRSVAPDGVDRPASVLPGVFGEAARSLADRLRMAWANRGPRAVVLCRLEAGSAAAPSVILADDYLNPALEEVRSAAAHAGEACLLARPGSTQLWVGPAVLPGKTPCVACLQERLRINLLARAFLHAPSDARSDAEARIERLDRDVPYTTFLRLARTLLEEEATLEDPGRLRVLTVGEGTEEAHAVYRLPHCPACGEPGLGPPAAKISLRPVPFVSRSGGGYRAKDPSETFQALAPLVSPLTGVIRYVRKVPVEAPGQVHVYTASHAHSYGASNLRTLRSDRRDHSGGKGMEDLDARVSAMCEAVERFSSVYRGTEEVRIAPLSDLGTAAVHPNELLLFSEAQFRGREAWNLEHRGGMQWVPEPYRDETIEWSPARSLVSGETLWVPSAALYLGFAGEGRRYCKGDSNGLASGNCLEEAILQGFLELVERDGVALWWYNRARLPAVDLGSFPDPRVAETQALYLKLSRDLWALDLTSDLAIPTFVALSARRQEGAEDIIFGFGAHLDPQIALLRALAELNQMLPTIERSPQERRRQLMPDFEEA
ncbi:MAG: TOMM precursor leader peptide-binding protein, partial [Candidatus Bipolaricaulota bacterium]